MIKISILLIESSAGLRTTLSRLLSSEGYAVISAGGQAEAARMAAKCKPQVVVLGPSTIEAGCVLNCAREMRRIAGSTPIVLVAEQSSEQLAISALRAGVNEYVSTACVGDELIRSIERCFAQAVTPAKLIPHAQIEPDDRMLGESAPMQEVRSRLRRIALTDSNVLITGETGTGKELAARMVFRNSRRSDKPFVTINCAAIPDSLFESELFGYEKGAFTGAHRSHTGKLKAADGGTVFLDEIGDMSPYAQSKMLRMIESREIQRIGNDFDVKVDVRIIAATNHDLESLANQNTFRKDLFFRLAVSSIQLPPLRDRKEDLLLLIDHHIRHFNHLFGRSVRCFSDQAIECLLAYDWPGNIRELRNLVEGVFVELPTEDIEVAELPPAFRVRCMAMSSQPKTERQILLNALLHTNWNKSKAANDLQWSRMKLYRKMAQYNIAAH